MTAPASPASSVRHYSAMLLVTGWQSELMLWFDLLEVPCTMGEQPPEDVRPLSVPWDGERLYLDPLNPLGPIGWIRDMLHVCNAVPNPRFSDDGLGLEAMGEANRALLESQMRSAAAAICVKAGATADWLWKPALHWKMTKASLYPNPEEVMERHIIQVKTKLDAWERLHSKWGLPVPPQLWQLQLISA